MVISILLHEEGVNHLSVYHHAQTDMILQRIARVNHVSQVPYNLPVPPVLLKRQREEEVEVPGGKPGDIVL